MVAGAAAADDSAPESRFAHTTRPVSLEKVGPGTQTGNSTGGHNHEHTIDLSFLRAAIRCL